MLTFYFCKICSNMLETIHDSGNVPICCGKPMEILQPAVTDGAKEKHVPVFSIEDQKLTVVVGETPHPMETSHYIEWIAICTNFGYYRRDLKPGNDPTMTIRLCREEKPLRIFAYCNMHGLWTTEP